MNRPRVLLFVDWFLPGFRGGGPIKSVEAIVTNLSADVDFDIITRDRDLQSKMPYAGQRFNQWVDFSSNARICYLSPGLKLGKIVSLTNQQSYGSVYVNSFFSFHYSIKIRLLYSLGFLKAKKFIVAPRGEMDASRRAIKPVKKKIFLAISKIFSLYKNARWHATSYLETADTAKMFGQAALITEIPNFSKVSDNHVNNSSKSAGALRIIFLSRIVPYKNLYFALKVLTKIDAVKFDIRLDIYGPIEDEEYWEKCAVQISMLNARGITINYKGEVAADHVKKIFSQYHLFFFPTLGENFGHVIAESLLVGTPVLLSDKTPWKDLELNDAGWAFALTDENAFADKIMYMASLDQIAFDAKVQKVISYSAETVNNPLIVERYIDLLT